MTDLSPAAQAVLDAFLDTPGEVPMPMWDYGRDLAAALRAAAEQIEDLYCESDIDDSDGVVFAMRQLMLIADELGGAQ